MKPSAFTSGARGAASIPLKLRRSMMHKRQFLVMSLCLVLALTSSVAKASPPTDDPTQASAPHRVSLPIVHKTFPRPTPTPTPTRTPTPGPTARVTVQNDLNCTLNLRLSGPVSYDWSIPAQSSSTYTVQPGTYNYTAITTCCGTASGTKTFSAGRSYT